MSEKVWYYGRMRKRVTLYRLLFGLFFLLISYAITSLSQKQPNLKQTLGEQITPTISLTTIPTTPQTFVSGSQIQATVPGVAAKVNRVIDGDTIEVILNGKKKKVRFIGINTPETVDPRKPVQCFGKEASNHAKQLLSGKTVYLESDPSQGDTDKYKRLLRYIWLDAQTNVNLAMVADGYAYEYTYDLPYKYQKEFKKAQQDAQNANFGLWSPTTCNGKK